MKNNHLPRHGQVQRALMATAFILFSMQVTAQDKIQNEWMVGTWKFCQDKVFRKTMKCLAPMHIIQFNADGSYVQSNSFGEGRYPFRGTWLVENDTLVLNDSTSYPGVFSSSGVDVYPLQLQNKNFIYSKTEIGEDDRRYLYSYFIRK